MYPMAMPLQYGGPHQPILHSSLYTTPLISGNYTAAQSFSNSGRQYQGRQCDLHPNTTSFYVNPQLTDDLHTTGISRGNSSSASNLIQHSNVLSSVNNHGNEFDSHAVNSRQKNFYSCNKQPTLNEELLQDMTKMHLGYIETEDSPHKMEQRQKLEDKILNFLSITPHQGKVAFIEVLDILENNITMRGNFNANETACAFEALAQYASNLISQPWRKEYRELKLYSGFWIHQISKYLVGAESILELMGYIPIYSKEQKNQFCNSSMPFKYVHNGVLDPDLISRLALDCMIAYCECKCLYRIKEGLNSYEFRYNQILDFRQRYVGDIDGTVRHLSYNMKQNLQKQSEAQRMISGSPPPLPSRYSSHGATLPDRPLKSPSASNANNHFSVPTNDKQRVPDSSTDCTKSSKHHSRGCSKYENNFRTDNRDIGTTDASAVPTARLIDLDCSIDGSSRGRHLLPKYVNRQLKAVTQNQDEVDFRSGPTSSQQISPELHKPATIEEHMAASLNLISKSSTNRTNSQQGKQSSENWGYVYDNLNKQGYNKDIGDRGDILNDYKHNSFSTDANPPKTYNYLNNKKDKHKPLPMNQALHQLLLNETKDKDVKNQSNKSYVNDKNGASKRISVYDNLSPRFDQPTDEIHKPSIKKLNNVFRDNRNDSRDVKCQSELREYISSERPRRSRHEDMSGPVGRNGSRHEDMSGPVGRNGSTPTWVCRSCTFINKEINNVCEICYKSKLKQDNTPLQYGSKECSKCTLINPSGTKYCSACNIPLDPCSTYI